MRKFLTFGGIFVLVAAGAVAAINQKAWRGYPVLRAHVAAQMKDPDSVQFRGEKLSSAGWLCGEMNAKNSFGAYDGFKRFTSRSEGEDYLEGVGYTGKGSQQTLQVVDDLLYESQALITVKQMIESDTVKISNDVEWQKLVDKLKFDARWKASCS
jgi:hypothetical protein